MEVRERVLVGFRFQYEGKTIMFIRNYKIGRQLEFVSARSAEITKALAVFLERVYSQNPFIGGDASGNSNS